MNLTILRDEGFLCIVCTDGSVLGIASCVVLVIPQSDLGQAGP